MSKRRKNRGKVLEFLEQRTLLASPLIITKGGTYSGEWESRDPKIAAVVVKTSEPVIIQNATIRGRGDLIASGVNNTNITVRNVKGYGLNPNVYGQTPGEFISVNQFDNLVVENSYFEHTRGINLLNYAGNRTPAETVRIVGNEVRNVDGRKSDGNGGYLTFNTRTRKSDGFTEDGFDYAQFVQFDKVLNVPNIEIAWNQVINEAGQSRVEDNISIYKSSGTAASPIKIHDNYIQGAYTIKPWQGDTSDATYNYDWGFSGGGIMLGDGVGSTAASDPAYVKAFSNTVISTTNYGIALSAGHDLEAYNNRVLSAGVLPDGRKIANQNVGIYVWDSYKAGSSRFYNVTAHDNLAGWVQVDGRNDWWTPQPQTMPNNTRWSGTITLMTELAEYSRWKALWAAQGGDDVGPIDPVDPVDPVDPMDPVDPVDPVDPPTENPALQVKGIVFDDRDGDGMRDASEPGVAGRRVYADLNNNKALDSNEPSALTSTTGAYAFDVTAEAYVVRMVVPSGWYQSSAAPAARAADAVSATQEFNLGAVKYAGISGTIFRDTDKDKIRDAGEAGISGAKVYIDRNNNGKFDAGEATATTNSSGAWSFTNLKPGTYYVRSLPKDHNYTRTTAAASFRHALLSGSSVKGDLFGYSQRAHG